MYNALCWHRVSLYKSIRLKNVKLIATSAVDIKTHVKFNSAYPHQCCPATNNKQQMRSTMLHVHIFVLYKCVCCRPHLSVCHSQRAEHLSSKMACCIYSRRRRSSKRRRVGEERAKRRRWRWGYMMSVGLVRHGATWIFNVTTNMHAMYVAGMRVCLC